jgi:hypothetical protein
MNFGTQDICAIALAVAVWLIFLFGINVAN